MYRSCIYCSADLGANESLEAFPIGQRVAFDAARGRLWAVCPKCGRWNLAPIEERWEPVEQAERLFRDARLRTHSENIGLAKLRDGTRLIRVGEALPGEMAAWRYGDQLVQRHTRYVLVAGAAAVGGALVLGGIAAATGAGVFFAQIGNFANLYRHWQGRKVFHYIAADRTGTGQAMQLRRWHLRQARLQRGEDGGLALLIPHAGRKDPPKGRWGGDKEDQSPLILPEAEARSVLTRGSVVINAKGANRKRVGEALELLSASASAEDYIRTLASTPHTLTAESPSGMRRRRRRGWGAADGGTVALTAPHRLALEMALHEEQERRALEGELTVLQAAWREAEEIAGIADRLAIAPAGE